MGNNKKAARSSRGRSNYVKMTQRSQPKARRMRNHNEPVAEQKSDMPLGVKGMITIGIAGMIVGTVFGNVILGILIGAAVGGVGGCIIDLIQNKAEGKKKN